MGRHREIAMKATFTLNLVAPLLFKLPDPPPDSPDRQAPAAIFSLVKTPTPTPPPLTFSRARRRTNQIRSISFGSRVPAK